jgi:hypothetical protein
MWKQQALNTSNSSECKGYRLQPERQHLGGL